MGGQQQGPATAQQQPSGMAPPQFGGGPQQGVSRAPFQAPNWNQQPQQPQTGFASAQNLGAQGNQPGAGFPSSFQYMGPNGPMTTQPFTLGGSLGQQQRPPAPPPMGAAVPNMQGPQMGGSASGTGLTPQPMNLFGSLSGGGAGKF